MKAGGDIIDSIRLHADADAVDPAKEPVDRRQTLAATVRRLAEVTEQGGNKALRVAARAKKADEDPLIMRNHRPPPGRVGER